MHIFMKKHTHTHCLWLDNRCLCVFLNCIFFQFQHMCILYTRIPASPHTSPPHTPTQPPSLVSNNFTTDEESGNSLSRFSLWCDLFIYLFIFYHHNCQQQWNHSLAAEIMCGVVGIEMKEECMEARPGLHTGLFSGRRRLFFIPT